MPSTLKPRLATLLSLAAIALVLSVCPSQAQKPLGNSDVLKLHTAGLGDDVIVTTITNSPGQYALSTDDLIALKKAGISDSIVSAMLRKNSGAAPAATASQTVSDASAVPAGVTDVGVYYMDKTGQYQDMATEIVNYKTGGVLKGLATGGIVKGDLNGNINGPASRLQIASPVKVIIYVLEGQSPNEYQLLHLRPNSNSREFRSKTGGIVHQSTGASRDLVEFDSKKIAPRIYEISLSPSVGRGEFGFLPPGNINSQNSAASSGKIYTFGITE